MYGLDILKANILYVFHAYLDLKKYFHINISGVKVVQLGAIREDEYLNNCGVKKRLHKMKYGVWKCLISANDLTV